MNEITSVPNSLRQQINNAQNLLAQSEKAQCQGNTELAVVRAREGLKVLRQISRQNPELGALLVAAEHGYTGIELTQVERIDSYEVLERKFLGISMGSEVVPTTTIKEIRRTIRLI